MTMNLEVSIASPYIAWSPYHGMITSHGIKCTSLITNSSDLASAIKDLMNFTASSKNTENGSEIVKTDREGSSEY